MADGMTYAIAAPRTALVEKAAALLAARLRERGVAAREAAAADVVLELRAEPGAEGFRIEGAPGGPVRIIGDDEHGLLYGVGKFLRTCRYAGGFVLSPWRGASAPAKPVRGIYFATHFHNWYHDAPIAEVERYVEDLALWGYNFLAVWFDLHHYTGIDDPAAQAMIARLRALLAAGAAVGMQASLTTLANEGYSTTPAALRATDTRRGFYGVEVCPSTPEGRALILENHRGRLEAFAGLPIAMLWLWPYDQGGCDCEHCRPWGANGMLEIGEAVARLARAYFPDARIVYSTWLFDYFGDAGEWSGLARAFTPAPDWVDYLMADSHTTFPAHPLREGMPGGLPALNFPEISMWGMFPWGGFGANPLVRRFQALWGSVREIMAGGFPYSEGIFEDVNKACYAGFYWTGATDAAETLREYAAYELGCADTAALAGVLDALEANHGQIWTIGFKSGYFGQEEQFVPLAGYPESYRLAAPHCDAGRAAAAFAAVERIDAALPAWARAGWRWRILYLRALLDAEILGHDGPTPACEEALKELIRLYHADRAEGSVLPPARMAVGV